MMDYNKKVSKLVYQGTSHLSTSRVKEVSQYKGFERFLQDFKPGDTVTISTGSMWSMKGITIKTYLEFVKNRVNDITVEDNEYATNFPMEMFLPVEVTETSYLSDSISSIESYDVY